MDIAASLPSPIAANDIKPWRPHGLPSCATAEPGGGRVLRLDQASGAGAFQRLAPSPCAQLVIAHSSLQARVSGFAPLVANPIGMLLLNPGECLTRVAVGGEGEVADVILLEPALASGLCRLTGMTRAQGERQLPLFTQPWANLSAEDYVALRLLLRTQLAAPEHEARLVAWVQRVLLAARADWKKRAVPARATLGLAERGRFDLAQAAAAYLDANWRRNVSLAELGDIFGLTTFYLLRAFRRAIGLTPHQYTLQLRLRRSLRMIELGGARLVDTAVGLGFSSHGHFSTAFRTTFGMTPAEYAGGRRAMRSRATAACTRGQSSAPA